MNTHFAFILQQQDVLPERFIGHTVLLLFLLSCHHLYSL